MICTNCRGLGRICVGEVCFTDITVTCSMCNGTGKVEKDVDLGGWLEDIKAELLFDIRCDGTMTKSLEVWVLPDGQRFIIETPRAGGWLIYTQLPEGGVARTLADAEQRLGIEV